MNKQLVLSKQRIIDSLKEETEKVLLASNQILIENEKNTLRILKKQIEEKSGSETALILRVEELAQQIIDEQNTNFQIESIISKTQKVLELAIE